MVYFGLHNFLIFKIYKFILQCLQTNFEAPLKLVYIMLIKYLLIFTFFDIDLTEKIIRVCKAFN
jgi:hypothetical protein